jgi:hypothetical protein
MTEAVTAHHEPPVDSPLATVERRSCRKPAKPPETAHESRRGALALMGWATMVTGLALAVVAAINLPFLLIHGRAADSMYAAFLIPGGLVALVFGRETKKLRRPPTFVDLAAVWKNWRERPN